MKRIPAILRIDVEPDDHQPAHGLPPWTGFVAMAEFIERLRERLADQSGVAVRPTWFLRLDPDIERSYGRADFVVDRYRGLIDQIVAHGDPLGIHVHFYRLDEKRQVTFSDHADTGWTAHCVDVSAGAFERCFDEPPRRSSQGGFFMSETVIDRAIAAGVQVDVTAEPGYPPQSAGATFGAYTTAPSPDFGNFPRYPYYPSRAAIDTPARSSADARPMLVVPLTAYNYGRALSSWPRRAAKAILRRPSSHHPLNPWKAWPNPNKYWNLVARAADEGPARYVALAVRTDPPGSPRYANARPLFECLPTHPIARRLCFVDPLAPEIRARADVKPGGPRGA